VACMVDRTSNENLLQTKRSDDGNGEVVVKINPTELMLVEYATNITPTAFPELLDKAEEIEEVALDNPFRLDCGFDPHALSGYTRHFQKRVDERNPNDTLYYNHTNIAPNCKDFTSVNYVPKNSLGPGESYSADVHRFGVPMSGVRIDNRNLNQTLHCHCERNAKKMYPMTREQNDELSLKLCATHDELAGHRYPQVTKALLAKCFAEAVATMGEKDAPTFSSVFSQMPKDWFQIKAFIKKQDKPVVKGCALGFKPEVGAKAAQNINAQPKWINAMCMAMTRAVEVCATAATAKYVKRLNGLSPKQFKSFFENYCKSNPLPGYVRSASDLTSNDALHKGFSQDLQRHIARQCGVDPSIMEFCYKANGYTWTSHEKEIHTRSHWCLQSGRIDTLKCNTELNYTLFAMVVGVPNIKLIVAQGDDIFSVHRESSYNIPGCIADAYKIESGKVLPCVGYILTDTVFPDVLRIATKILNRRYPNRTSIIQYQEAVADQLNTLVRTGQDHIACAQANALYYKTTMMFMNGVMRLLYAFTNDPPCDIEQYIRKDHAFTRWINIRGGGLGTKRLANGGGWLENVSVEGVGDATPPNEKPIEDLDDLVTAALTNGTAYVKATREILSELRANSLPTQMAVFESGFVNTGDLETNKLPLFTQAYSFLLGEGEYQLHLSDEGNSTYAITSGGLRWPKAFPDDVASELILEPYSVDVGLTVSGPTVVTVTNLPQPRVTTRLLAFKATEEVEILELPFVTAGTRTTIESDQDKLQQTPITFMDYPLTDLEDLDVLADVSQRYTNYADYVAADWVIARLDEECLKRFKIAVEDFRTSYPGDLNITNRIVDLQIAESVLFLMSSSIYGVNKHIGSAVGTTGKLTIGGGIAAGAKLVEKFCFHNSTPSITIKSDNSASYEGDLGVDYGSAKLKLFSQTIPQDPEWRLSYNGNDEVLTAEWNANCIVRIYVELTYNIPGVPIPIGDISDIQANFTFDGVETPVVLTGILTVLSGGLLATYKGSVIVEDGPKGEVFTKQTTGSTETFELGFEKVKNAYRNGVGDYNISSGEQTSYVAKTTREIDFTLNAITPVNVTIVPPRQTILSSTITELEAFLRGAVFLLMQEGLELSFEVNDLTQRLDFIEKLTRPTLFSVAADVANLTSMFATSMKATLRMAGITTAISFASSIERGVELQAAAEMTLGIVQAILLRRKRGDYTVTHQRDDVIASVADRIVDNSDVVRLLKSKGINPESPSDIGDFSPNGEHANIIEERAAPIINFPGAAGLQDVINNSNSYVAKYIRRRHLNPEHRWINLRNTFAISNDRTITWHYKVGVSDGAKTPGTFGVGAIAVPNTIANPGIAFSARVTGPDGVVRSSTLKDFSAEPSPADLLLERQALLIQLGHKPDKIRAADTVAKLDAINSQGAQELADKIFRQISGRTSIVRQSDPMYMAHGEQPAFVSWFVKNFSSDYGYSLTNHNCQNFSDAFYRMMRDKAAKPGLIPNPYRPDHDTTNGVTVSISDMLLRMYKSILNFGSDTAAKFNDIIGNVITRRLDHGAQDYQRVANRGPARETPGGQRDYPGIGGHGGPPPQGAERENYSALHGHGSQFGQIDRPFLSDRRRHHQIPAFEADIRGDGMRREPRSLPGDDPLQDHVHHDEVWKNWRLERDTKSGAPAQPTLPGNHPGHGSGVSNGRAADIDRRAAHVHRFRHGSGEGKVDPTSHRQALEQHGVGGTHHRGSAGTEAGLPHQHLGGRGTAHPLPNRQAGLPPTQRGERSGRLQQRHLRSSCGNGLHGGGFLALRWSGGWAVWRCQMEEQLHAAHESHRRDQIGTFCCELGLPSLPVRGGRHSHHLTPGPPKPTLRQQRHQDRLRVRGNPEGSPDLYLAQPQQRRPVRDEQYRRRLLRDDEGAWPAAHARCAGGHGEQETNQPKPRRGNRRPRGQDLSPRKEGVQDWTAMVRQVGPRECSGAHEIRETSSGETTDGYHPSQEVSVLCYRKARNRWLYGRGALGNRGGRTGDTQRGLAQCQLHQQHHTGSTRGLPESARVRRHTDPSG